MCNLFYINYLALLLSSMLQMPPGGPGAFDLFSGRLKPLLWQRMKVNQPGVFPEDHHPCQMMESHMGASSVPAPGKKC